jgi:hypothetical protein
VCLIFIRKKSGVDTQGFPFAIASRKIGNSKSGKASTCYTEKKGYERGKVVYISVVLADGGGGGG